MTEPCPIDLTPAAREQIRRLGGLLQIALEPGGCCGTAYAYALEGQMDDLQFLDGGLTVRLSAQAIEILKGAKLDYGPRLKPPRFRVLNNPNTPQRCACNRSFGQPFPGKATAHCLAYEPMPWAVAVRFP